MINFSPTAYGICFILAGVPLLKSEMKQEAAVKILMIPFTPGITLGAKQDAYSCLFVDVKMHITMGLLKKM